MNEPDWKEALKNPHLKIKADFGPRGTRELEQPHYHKAKAQVPGKPRKKRGRPEHEMQVAFFNHLRGYIPFLPQLKLAHSPKNDFKQKKGKPDFALWNYLKAEGVRAGIPDVFIPIRTSAMGGKVGFYLELKAPGETPTEEQVEFLALVRNEGYFANWTDHLAVALNWLDEYLKPLLDEKRIERKR